MKSIINQLKTILLFSTLVNRSNKKVNNFVVIIIVFLHFVTDMNR